MRGIGHSGIRKKNIAKMITALILALALLFTVIVVNNAVYRLKYNVQDSDADFTHLLIFCFLWGLFYYLTH